MIKDKNE